MLNVSPYVDPALLVLIQPMPDGSYVGAPLVKGPNGYAQADFGQGFIESEMPNLVVLAAKKVA